MSEREQLLELLNDINEDIPFESETALIDDGHINSLDLTTIIAAINDAFSVRISPADLEPENFNSVDAMLAMIRRKKGRA